MARSLVLDFLFFGFVVVESLNSRKYCIIGAGPAGVQLGQYFMHAKVDYATFELAEHAGSFFKKYPIHRKLISVNKRSTRSTSQEFNLRHDWNSLMDTKVPPFTTWTDEYYPHADVLVDYLRAVAAEQEGHIFYGYNVAEITPSESSDAYYLEIDISGGRHERWHCSVLIGATGLRRPNKPTNWIRGLDKAVGYEELDKYKEEDFSNRTVLILGNGNAAFETADAIRNWASEISIFGKRGQRKAMESHYVGDVRGHRLTTEDSLELKTLDDVWNVPPRLASKLELIECEGTEAGQGWPQYRADKELLGFYGRRPLCVVCDHSEDEFLIADNDPENPFVSAALNRWGQGLQVRNVSKEYIDWHKDMIGTHGQYLLQAAGMEDAFETTVLTMSKATVRQLSSTSPEFRKALPKLIATTQGLWLSHASFRKPVDVVIRALGWKMETDPYRKLKVMLDKNMKYPKVDACYGAYKEDGKPFDNLFFAGTVSHGFDRFRFGSAGGFIHGFRYTSKVLFRCLMSDFEGRDLWGDVTHVFPWAPVLDWKNESKAIEECSKDVCPDKPIQPSKPSKRSRQSPAKLRKELEETPHWSHLLQRANEASGPYQMACGALMDGIVYNRTGRTASYIEDMPLDLFEAKYKDQPRLILHLRYGQGADYDALEPKLAPPSGLRSGIMAWASKFLHPVFIFAQPGAELEDESSRLHLVEDRWTDYAGREEVLACHNFFRNVEKAAWEGPSTKLPQFHEKQDLFKLQCAHWSEAFKLQLQQARRDSSST